MSKMKDLFIQMQNEDWERMPLHERAIIEAERRLDEEQLWLEIMQEEEALKQLEQAKIVQEDDTNQEVREDITAGPGPEPSDIATILREESRCADIDEREEQGGSLDDNAGA